MGVIKGYGTGCLNKESCIAVKVLNSGVCLPLQKGRSLMELLIENGMTEMSHCGGKGICGRCAIRFIENPTMPAAGDRMHLTPEELRKGMRLACLSRPVKDCTVEILWRETPVSDIVTIYDRTYKPADMEVLMEGKAQITAVDLGTTTIAVQVLEAGDGKILGEYRQLNPQRVFGADIISRMEASLSGNREKLQAIITGELEKGISKLWEQTGVSAPIIISGNTVMGHLLMGQSVMTLAAYPFVPVSIAVQEIDLLGQKAVLMPGISAFVGADIVSDLLALNFINNNDVNLLIDLGTNGEMAIGCREGILCTATAAGPAFEGGAAAGLHGSDMISITADMLELGILDNTGLLRDPYFGNGYSMGESLITQKDIRELQTAKAAVNVGIQILMEEYRICADKIGRVYLAGGFGHYLDVKKAGRIGLLPEALQNKVSAVGNTSLLGAFLYGRKLLRQKDCSIVCVPEAEKIIRHAEHINLAEHRRFQELYISELNFPG